MTMGNEKELSPEQREELITAMSSCITTVHPLTMVSGRSAAR